MSELQRWRDTYASDILGSSPAIMEATRFVRRCAGSDSSVLLTGETGTGKELFARALHRASPRHARPFVAVNCAALPEALIEAELFGYVRGAFTGAVQPRSGKFLSADGGTLFLDEIGDLPLVAQAKLLRVLEQRMVSPVGADHDLPVDVRIIVATHRDLEEMVENGKFRADLYFRISVLPLELPALRDRGDDVLVLAEALLARCAGRGPAAVLDASAQAALREYAWPGNVRELLHVLERALMLASGPVLRASDLNLGGRRKSQPHLVVPPDDPPPGRAEVTDDCVDLRTALESLERTMIKGALKRAQGNRTEAAALLGLNRTTLVEKLRKYG